MIELSKGGAYLLNGTEIIEDGSNAAAELSALMAAMQQQNSQQSWGTQHLLRKRQQRIQLPMVF